LKGEPTITEETSTRELKAQVGWPKIVVVGATIVVGALSYIASMYVIILGTLGNETYEKPPNPLMGNLMYKIGDVFQSLIPSTFIVVALFFFAALLGLLILVFAIYALLFLIATGGSLAAVYHQKKVYRYLVPFAFSVGYPSVATLLSFSPEFRTQAAIYLAILTLSGGHTLSVALRQDGFELDQENSALQVPMIYTPILFFTTVGLALRNI